MVMNLDLVCMVCQCNVYVIPESVSRKDLGYKDLTSMVLLLFLVPGPGLLLNFVQSILEPISFFFRPLLLFLGL